MRTRFSWGLIALAILFSFLIAPEGELRAEKTTEAPILFRQGGFEGKIFPILGSIAPEEFYNYSLFDYQSRTSLEIPRHGIITLYRHTRTGKLALIIILNAPNAGPSGQMGLQIQGLPSNAQLALQDDPNDEYSWNIPNAQFRWRWASGRTDGVVITDLQEPFTLTITPQSVQGITGWKLYTLKDLEVGPERVPLPELTEPITLRAGEGQAPQAAFHITPEQVYAQFPITFDARPSQVLLGQIVRYEWDFDGDGVFEVSTNQPIVTHIFNESGAFTVTLRITDINGLTNTISQTVEVRAQRTGAWRMISTPQVQPQGVFRVTVSFQVDVPTNGLGVEEQWPVGWTIEPVRNDGAVFKFTHSRGQWIFPALLKIGEMKSIVYDVRVPPAEEVAGPPLPARYSVQGSVTSVSPAYSIPIGAESEVEVVTCLSAPVAIAHLDLESGQIDLRRSEMISAEQLTRALGFWTSRAAVPGTCDAPLSSDALLRVLLYPLLNIPVDQPLNLGGPTTAPASLTVTRTITSQLPAAQVYLKAKDANVLHVELTIFANQEIPGLLITEQLPEGWAIQPQGVANAYFRADTNEWILAELIPSGQSRRLVYDVIVPQDAVVGEAEWKGSVQVGPIPTLIPIQGTGRVEVIECLSVPAAMAHLNVTTGEIDLSLDNIISSEQGEAAFRFWLEEKEVPGTCGKKIDLATLQQITTYVLTGNPVEK